MAIDTLDVLCQMYSSNAIKQGCVFMLKSVHHFSSFFIYVSLEQVFKELK